MNTQMFTQVYAAALHVAAVAAMVVLLAMGKVTWAEGGPILAGLLGVGAGAGLALVVPGVPLPSGTPVSPQSAGDATLAPVTAPSSPAAAHVPQPPPVTPVTAQTGS